MSNTNRKTIATIENRESVKKRLFEKLQKRN